MYEGIDFGETSFRKPRVDRFSDWVWPLFYALLKVRHIKMTMHEGMCVLRWPRPFIHPTQCSPNPSVPSPFVLLSFPFFVLYWMHCEWQRSRLGGRKVGDGPWTGGSWYTLLARSLWAKGRSACTHVGANAFIYSELLYRWVLFLNRVFKDLK